MSTLPQLDPAARHGWFGEVVDTLGPETEACEAALLVQLLAMFGCAVGVRPYFPIGGARHSARINVLLTGNASSGRKGQSAAEVGAVFRWVDPDLYEYRVMSGLASGEGLIAAVRDGDPNNDEDQGVTDKRLQIIEPEFSRVLRVASRDGSTLSEILRECFDTGRLRVMTRKDPMVATGAHVCVTGHVTPSEFLERMKELDVNNGFLTRFLVVEAGRTQLLPHGGNLTEEDFKRLGRTGAKNLAIAREFDELRHSAGASKLWSDLYRLIHQDNRPEVGTRWAIMARADTNLLRLSMIYALGDASRVIDVDHIEAAWAVMTYVDDSVARLFGTLTGNRTADRILERLPSDPLQGLDGTQQRDLFDRHATGEQLADARGLLSELGLAETISVKTGGRPRLVTYRQSDESAIGDQTPARESVWSLRSLRSRSQRQKAATNGHGPIEELSESEDVAVTT